MTGPDAAGARTGSGQSLPAGDLDGETALVTGGSAGIGFAIASAFAERGARVAVSGRDGARAAEAARGIASRTGGEAIGLAADVRDRAAVGAAVDRVVERFGGIDILVNSAGIAGAGPSEELAEEAWDAILDTNLKGTFLACQAAARHMLVSGGGAIVNIASIAGLGGFPRRAAYGSSKAGVIMLTKVLAVEWADRHVRVNAIAPGIIRTELHEAMVATGHLDPAAIERRTPCRRRGEPAELIGAAVLLASPASAFTTGAVLAVDGGWSAYAYL